MENGTGVPLEAEGLRAVRPACGRLRAACSTFGSLKAACSEFRRMGAVCPVWEAGGSLRFWRRRVVWRLSVGMPGLLET